MSIYPLYTDIDALPASSTGKRRVKTFHVEDSFEALSQHLENLTRGAFAAGGVLIQGTHTHDDVAKTVNVQGFLGVSTDTAIVLLVPDATVDYSSAGAVKILVVARALPVEVARTYTDPETSESITHNMLVRRGVLMLIEGDATNYPAATNADAVVGHLDNTASPATYTPASVPAVLRPASGPTADRPSSPPTGAMFFDTDLGKPIWWDGTQWVDATGTAV